jgi:hypothetical protein
MPSHGTFIHRLLLELSVQEVFKSFASIFLDYFFSSTNMLHVPINDLDDICDVSSFFCELAVCDYFFVPLRASHIALASILNALEGTFGPDNNLAGEVIRTAQQLGLAVHLDLSAARNDLSAAHNRLWELYKRNEECALNNDTSIDEDPHGMWHGNLFVKKMSNVSSPVSVVKLCQHHSATDFAYHAKHTRL